MEKEERARNIVLAVIVLISLIMGILNSCLLVSVMFVLTAAGAIYIIKERNLYTILYELLFVSAAYDYTLFTPKASSIYMFHIVLFIWVLYSIFKFIKEKEIKKKIDKRIIIMLGIWFAYIVLSCLWADNKKLAVKYTAIYIMMFSFIISVMIFNINKKRLKITYDMVLYIFSVIICVGTVEVLIGKQLPVKHYIDEFIDSLPEIDVLLIQARPSAFSFNTNNFAALIAILAPFALFAIYRSRTILAKIWFTLISVLAFMLVITTTSRTGFVAVTAGYMIFAVFSVFKIKKLGIKQMIYPAVIIISMFISYNYAGIIATRHIENGKEYAEMLNKKFESLNNTVNGEGKENSALERGIIIKDVLNGVIKEGQYQGFGAGNTENYLEKCGNTNNIYSPHCYPIEILGDFGIPGIIIYGTYFLYILGSNIIIFKRGKNDLNMACTASMTAFIPACFGPSSITYVFAYWIMMAVSISSMQVMKKEEGKIYTARQK